MKTASIVAATLILAAAGVSAQEATYELPQPVTSATTRAAVTADVLSARANGTLQVSEFDRQAWAPFVSERNRDDVRAEARAAAARGELRALHGEPSSFDGRVVSSATLDAAPVLAAAK
jgi:hypothetical protein